MENFNYRQRLDYNYVPGLTIAYMLPDLSGQRIGTIKRDLYSNVELTTGQTVNKALIFAMLSKDKNRSLINAG